jgi:spore maturation protein CgeB
VGINRGLFDAAREFEPDIAWIEKGNMIRPGTLKALKKMRPGLRLAAYSDDDMYLAHNRSSHYTAGLRIYDCVFTTKAANTESAELVSLGARRVVLVDKAFDPRQHHPVSLSESDRHAYSCDVGFIGSYESERGAALNFLAANGVSVRVWGNGWRDMPAPHPNLRLELEPVVNTNAAPNYTKCISATRINLGFLRKLNRDLHSDRSVEIPACGGFMLAERTTDHLRLFEEGREAAYFESPDELLTKVRHYLANDAERRMIAASGLGRCRTGGYDLDTRAQRMLSVVLDTPAGDEGAA